MFRYILPVMLFAAFINAQEISDFTLAKIGNNEITGLEFEVRYQLNPQSEIHRKLQSEANKRIFLYGLIAEKLLALDASEKSMDTSVTVKYFLKNFEKMFVRDELYRKEIKERSENKASEILSFYLENSPRIFTKTIISRNETQIKQIYSLLQQGLLFDSLYAEMSPGEKDTITLYSGNLDTEIEKEIFILPEKSFSKPVYANDYWIIFYVEKKSDPVIAKSLGWESEYKRLEKAASEKAEAAFYKEYMKNFFPGKKAEANGFFIKSLAEKISGIFSESSSKDSNYTAASSDFIKIRNMYPEDSLNAVFVIMDDDKILFRDFLHWLRTENFSVKQPDYQTTASMLNSKVKKFIEYELLAKEGYRQELDKSDNVKRNYAMWKDNYLYQLNLSAISDTIFSANKDYSYVKLAEIVNNDLNVIEKALNDLSEGKDFFQATVKYSSRMPDTSYRPFSDFGDIKDDILLARPGEIYGPVNSENGYVIFKILDIKTSDGLQAAGLSAGKSIDKYIAGLAKKYKLVINEELLQEIRTTNINAMVFQYLGFGGRLSAVPVIKPMSGWFPEWKKEIELNP